MHKRDTLLIVDDMEVNRAILRSLFEKEYNVLEAENGERALGLLDQYQDNIEAMLLDLVMPIKNGYQVMEAMGREGLLAKVPVVVITSDDTAESEVKAFDLGASDIIMKPFEPHVVKRRVQNIVELNRHRMHLEELVEEQSVSLRESNSIMIDTLSSVIEYRNLESGQHIKRVRMFTKILLEDVAKTYQEYDLDTRKIGIIASASSMHDIGKIAIPDAILNKPGRLTKEEFEIMKTHTLKGCEILSSLNRMNDQEYLGYAYNICRYHHERWDGSGYPDGLKGDNIPICAQVVAIADCYDALTTDRVYKKALPQDVAFNMILNGECGVFSPRLLECFKNVRESFAKISRAYADGRPPEADVIMPSDLNQAERNTKTSTQEFGQMKYLALLRYLNATVMEVDLKTGLYHLVYLADDDFELLRSGKGFDDAVRSFAEEAVHPDDRGMVLRLLNGYLDDFFQEGYLKQSRRYRVYSRLKDGYCWCRATILRVDMENPHQRKAVLVWEKTGEPDAVHQQGRELRKERAWQFMGGVNKCANDKYFTLIQADKGFQELIGYTQKELKEEINNHYIKLIHPADQEEVLRQVKKQLVSGTSLELEYRMVTRDGRIVWVLDKSRMVVEEDGYEYFYSVLMDITQSRQAQEELRLTLERYRIVISQTKDIIFEWDMKKDKLRFFGNWEKKYGYPPVTSGMKSQINRFPHVNPDDIPALTRYIASVTSGSPYGEVEFRLADIDGIYRWCRCRTTILFDELGAPDRAVGVITDIDQEKKTAREMQDKIERDVLTKLFNRAAARKQIIRYLDRQRKGMLSAMLIIDVDDFKQINDSYGHMFGDAVLTELAAQISKQFRAGDVVSRIGGDEFLVFMPDISDRQVAIDRADRMIRSFQEKMDENLGHLPFSCSVGIAFSPDDGRDFSVLFQHSDAALYQTKADGKNGWQCYDEDTMENVFDGGKDMHAAVRIQTAIDSIGEDSPEHLMARSLDILYESDSVEDAAKLVLALIGERFSASRVYICQVDQTGTIVRETLEWCADPAFSLKEFEQGCPVIYKGEDYRDFFDGEGILCCQEMEKMPRIFREAISGRKVLSVFQSMFKEGGEFKGFLGIDDCSVKRIWTQVQVDCLVSISRILGLFLGKR